MYTFPIFILVLCFCFAIIICLELFFLYVWIDSKDTKLKDIPEPENNNAKTSHDHVFDSGQNLFMN